tara:strand:+ start:3774 stop:4028 length:255 start_codon:yes stop_codon:yes gene_type:complete
MEKVKVAEMFLVKSEDGKQFIGVDLDFTSEVTNRQGGVFVLDFLRQCMNSAGWTTRTVMDIKETTNAPLEKHGDNEDDKTAETN